MQDKQTEDGIRAEYTRATEKLGKWRSVLVGWIWGTRHRGQPGTQGMRDLMDARLVARIELSAIAALLIEKGVFTRTEFMAQVAIEAGELDAMYERLFEGYRTTDQGLSIDPNVAVKTNQRLGFPP